MPHHYKGIIHTYKYAVCGTDGAGQITHQSLSVSNGNSDS